MSPASSIRHGNFSNLGVVDTVPAPDFPALLKKMGEIQQKIASILDEETRSAGVDIIYGRTGRL